LERAMTPQFARAAGLLFCPLALAILAPRSVLAQSTGTIRGRVLDTGGQRPIADAQISVVGTQLGAITNAAGEYVVSNVPSGPRQVRVRRIGFRAEDRTVSVTAGGTVSADFD